MKVFTYEIWDKVSKINGLPPEHYFESHFEFTLDDVILFKNNQGIVEGIESVLTLKSLHNMDSSLSSIEVAEEHIRIRTKNEESTNKENLSLGEAHDKISILEEENKKLKEVTKDQDNLLVDNAYKITILEMNLGGK